MYKDYKVELSSSSAFNNNPHKQLTGSTTQHRQPQINFKIGSQKKNIQILRSQLLSAGNETKKENIANKIIRKHEVEVIKEEGEKPPKTSIYSQGIKTRNAETKMQKLNS